MPGLSIGAQGSRAGVQATASGRLKDAFGDKWTAVDGILLVYAQNESVPIEVLYKVLLSEVKPVDWKKWPKTWLGEVRVCNFLYKLKPMYWEAFRTVPAEKVIATIDEWNSWRQYPVGKMGRLIGRSVSVKKAYWLGSKLKDMWVVSYLINVKGIMLQQQFINFVKIVRDTTEIAPYEWQWVDLKKVIAPPKTVSKYSMVETGE